MGDMYYTPEQHGLQMIGQIDWSDGCYQFSLTVVWRRVSDGALLYGEDSGCSCPSPFEATAVEDLTVATVDEIMAHLRSRTAEDGDRSAEMATLLERMLTA